MVLRLLRVEPWELLSRELGVDLTAWKSGGAPAYGPWHPVPVGSFPESVATHVAELFAVSERLYRSDHFLNQLQPWGINPSIAFIERPQGNGVAERFIRTLKEQVFYGQIFQNLARIIHEKCLKRHRVSANML